VGREGRSDRVGGIVLFGKRDAVTRACSRGVRDPASPLEAACGVERKCGGVGAEWLPSCPAGWKQVEGWGERLAMAGDSDLPVTVLVGGEGS
jgi:hypothetical protein